MTGIEAYNYKEICRVVKEQQEYCKKEASSEWDREHSIKEAYQSILDILDVRVEED